jgi:hypothetical protein
VECVLPASALQQQPAACGGVEWSGRVKERERERFWPFPAACLVKRKREREEWPLFLVCCCCSLSLHPCRVCTADGESVQ